MALRDYPPARIDKSRSNERTNFVTKLTSQRLFFDQMVENVRFKIKAPKTAPVPTVHLNHRLDVTFRGSVAIISPLQQLVIVLRALYYDNAGEQYPDVQRGCWQGINFNFNCKRASSIPTIGYQTCKFYLAKCAKLYKL